MKTKEFLYNFDPENKRHLKLTFGCRQITAKILRNANVPSEESGWVTKRIIKREFNLMAGF